MSSHTGRHVDASREVDAAREIPLSREVEEHDSYVPLLATSRPMNVTFDLDHLPDYFVTAPSSTRLGL